VTLANGDLLKVGPFQFRVELAPTPAASDDAPVEEIRAALRIQAAAVAAQQAALEEEETRLQQRRSDLQQQEEQLAAHLAEKQRQVQLWSDYTKAERDTLRQEKIDQEKQLDELEQEIREAKEDLSKDQQQLTQERQRINQVYQRLRLRWRKQWSAEREKHRNQAAQLQADALATTSATPPSTAQEAPFSKISCSSTRGASSPIGNCKTPAPRCGTDQERWRRRRAHEFAVLKGIERRTGEAQLKLKQARQLLLAEKAAWTSSSICCKRSCTA